MNNKGFTLVELLAVMVILLSISVIAVTNVTASLKRNEEQELKTYEKIAINAAKIYFSMTGIQSSDQNAESVYIYRLIENKYIKDDTKFSEIKKDGEILKNCFVKVCTNDYQVLAPGRGCK